jgi:phosphosulfolactate synthase
LSIFCQNDFLWSAFWNASGAFGCYPVNSLDNDFYSFGFYSFKWRAEMTKKKAWSDLLPRLVPDRMTIKPREQGLTMVLDKGQGLLATEDLLDLAGDHIDYIKLSFGTSFLMDEAVLRRKIELIRTYQIDVFPGGTLMEATLVQGVYPEYVQRAKELGFTTLEISDGTINMSRQTRDECIKRALDAGLKVISEAGKKDPEIYLSPAQICDQIAGDLSVGADKAIIEARESGKGIGIYDNEGALREDVRQAILSCLGDSRGDVIWEAPLKNQQTALILRCGPNVSLGNIQPNDVLGLEALRCGLRFDTLQHLVPQPELAALGDELPVNLY